MLLSYILNSIARDYSIESLVLYAVSTGVAAHNISSCTLHMLYCLLMKMDKYDQLSSQSLQSIQAIFCSVSYLIINKKSMIGLKQLL
jgi:hypothetical protein